MAQSPARPKEASSRGGSADRAAGAGRDGMCPMCGCPAVRWLRVGTVARQFGVSEKRVRRLLKAGAVDGVLFGGQWRIDHESLDHYVVRDSVRFVSGTNHAR